MQVDAESGLVIPDGQDLRSISLRRPTLTEVALEPCCQGSGQTGICVGSGGLSRHLSKVQNCNQKFVPVVCNLKSTKRGTKRHKKEHGLYKSNPENHAQLIFGLRPVSPEKDH